MIIPRIHNDGTMIRPLAGTLTLLATLTLIVGCSAPVAPDLAGDEPASVQEGTGGSGEASGYPQHVPNPQLTYTSMEHKTYGDGRTYWQLGYPDVDLAEAEAVAEQLQNEGLTLRSHLPGGGGPSTWFFDLDGQLIELRHNGVELSLYYVVWDKE